MNYRYIMIYHLWKMDLNTNLANELGHHLVAMEKPSFWALVAARFASTSLGQLGASCVPSTPVAGPLISLKMPLKMGENWGNGWFMMGDLWWELRVPPISGNFYFDDWKALKITGYSWKPLSANRKAVGNGKVWQVKRDITNLTFWVCLQMIDLPPVQINHGISCAPYIKKGSMVKCRYQGWTSLIVNDDHGSHGFQ